MMKRFLVLCLLGLSAVTMMAQRNITGKVVDRDTKEAVMQATVSLLKTDSTFVKGVISDTEGRFKVAAPANGDYLLKITSVAYKTLVKKITVSNGNGLQLGDVVLSADAIMLKEAIATGQAAKVVVKEDTFVYNAAAYRTPEGSVVEELVKRIPGAQIDDDGKITINGKEVKKIKVDGKEFMTGDTETALKNLPTAIIDNIKAYDERSDLSRVTGIDDGNEETVLDFGIKRGMNKGFMSNSDLAIGTKNRYSGRTMLSYMKDDFKVMGFGQANNTGDRGFPGGGGGWGGGSNGLSASKMLGLNLNYELPKILKIDGSVRWNHNDTDNFSKRASENFISTPSSFDNSISQSFNRQDRINANMRLEWTPDTMTNIMFRPSISFSKRDGTSTGLSATFNQDPYLYVENPLEEIKKLADLDAVVNTNENKSLSYSENNNVRGMLQFNRKFGSKGRNLTLRLNANYSDGQSMSSSIKDVQYFLTEKNPNLTRRYNTTPTKNYSYTGQVTYSEPIAKALFLQMSYNFTYSLSKSDRSTYSYDNLPGFETWMPEYRQWDAFFKPIPGDPKSDQYLDKDLSKYSEYNNYTHEAQLMVRKFTNKMNLSAGIMMQPQSSTFKYKYMAVDTIVKRSVLNFSPSLDFRYKFDKVSQLRATYRGSSDQPSMTDLLEIRDDSDPQNITTGNAGLKPSFTQNFNLRFNKFIQSHMQSIMTFVNFSTTSNAISQAMSYDATTGVKTTRPENINGNWNTNVGLMYNTAIDSVGVWNINTFTNFNYNNRVAYLVEGLETNKNTVRTTGFMERLAFSYRGSWLEVEPNAFVNYSMTKNLLQPNNNMNTWNFNYGLNITITAPWGTGFSTDAHMNSRRGYEDKSLNTNEFVWNAQVSHSFLKGRPLTVSLQFYDILQNRSNFSRSISSISRTDSDNNSINSYAMLHVIFRFNSFGGKSARQGGDARPDFSDPRFNRGGGFGGGQRPGGGRPGGFGGGGRF